MKITSSSISFARTLRLFTLAGCVLIAPHAKADTKTWQVSSGNWNVSGNWSGGLPGSSDVATISNNGTILLPTGVSGAASSVLIGSTGTGALSITGGSLTDSTGEIGTFSGSRGTATISSGTWSNTFGLFVGDGGTGTLNLDGGNVISSIAELGHAVGSNGTATIKGGLWNNSNGFTVGEEGSGTLNIIQNGVVTIGGGLGTLNLGRVGGSGTLNIGNPGNNAGTLNAAAVSGGLGTATVNFNSGSTTTFAPQIIGNVAVNNIYASETILTGNNTYTGTTTITGITTSNPTSVGGTLQIGNGGTTGTLGSGPVVNNGTLAFNRRGSLVVANDISGIGSLQQIGTGTTYLTGNNTSTGSTLVKAGTLVVAAGGVIDHTGGSINDLPEVNLTIGKTSGDNGALAITGGSVHAFYSYLGLQNGAYGTATVNSGSWTNEGLLIVGQFGNGTITINGGTVTGATEIGFSTGSHGAATINGGTWNGSLDVGYRGTGTLTIAGGAITSYIANFGIEAGSIGTATVSGGTWTNAAGVSVGIRGSGTLNITGGSVSSDILTIAQNANSTGTVNIGTGGTAGTIATNEVTGGSGTAIVNFNHTGTSTFDPKLTGNLTVNKLGTGATTLTGSNNYSGATTVAGGVISVSNLANGGSGSGIGASSNAATNLVLNGGSLRYTGAVESTDRLFSVGTAGGTIDSSGSGPITFTNSGSMGFNNQLGTRTLTLAGTAVGNLLLAGIGDHGGATSVVKTGSGSWTLGVNNTYTGGTTIQDGSLDVITGGTLGNGPVTNNGSVTVSQTDATVVTNPISGTGSFLQAGPGTTTLTGTNTYTGATTVSQGTLVVDGSISSSSGVTINSGATLAGHGSVSGIVGAGTVAPGNSPGILTATQVNPSGGIDFNFQFTKTGAPLYSNAGASGNDVLHLTGSTPFTFTLGSTNTITLDFTGLTLEVGQTYLGGFFTDTLVDASMVDGATFDYLGTNGATIQFDGFAPVSGADFAGGPVDGQILRFEVTNISSVPEPTTAFYGVLTMLSVTLRPTRRQSAKK